MPKTLGDYLNEVARSLGALPQARRDEELREMRQHLLNAVTINKEFGQSDDEATANAIEQFGAAQTIGENVVAVWRREKRLDAFKVAGAAVVTPMLLGILIYSLTCVSFLLQGLFDNTFLLHHLTIVAGLGVSLLCLVSGLVGVILGTVVPRQAVRGTLLGMMLGECIQFAPIGGTPFPTEPSQYVLYVLDLSMVLATVFCAWLVSRRRLGRQSRNSTSVS